MTTGGIFPAIAGSAFVTLITTLFAIPLGIAAAIYLSEYARENFMNQVIRRPSGTLPVYPLLFTVCSVWLYFVQALNQGTSVLASGLTLGLLTLPYIITTSEEAIKNVPAGLPGRRTGPGCYQVAGHIHQCATRRYFRYNYGSYPGLIASNG